MLLSELLSRERVKVPLAGRTKDDVLRELVAMVASGRDGADAGEILASVHDREKVLSTGIGGGVAIPHGKTPRAGQLMLAAGVTREPIEYDALDGKPVCLFFLLVGPESAASAHVKALSRISRLLRKDRLRQELVGADSPDAFIRIVQASETP